MLNEENQGCRFKAGDKAYHESGLIGYTEETIKGIMRLPDGSCMYSSKENPYWNADSYYLTKEDFEESDYYKSNIADAAIS